MTRTIGLFIDTLTGISGYQEAVWRGVSDAARERGVRVVTFAGGALEFAPLNPFEKSRNIAYELFDPSLFDGVVICGGTLGNAISPERFAAFCDRFSSIPMVSVGSAGTKVPRVLVDNDRGMREIVLHLLRDHRYTRVAFISGPRGNVDADRRREVFMRAMAESGVAVDERLVHEGDFNDHSGYEAVVRWFDQLGLRPEAIVASNDNMAFGALAALQDRGISVPSSVAVTGFDDVQSAAAATPPLSTVRQPVHGQARRALFQLLDRIDGKDIEFEVREAPEQVHRQSCGCYSRGLAAFADRPAPSRDRLEEEALSELGVEGSDPRAGKIRSLARLFQEDAGTDRAVLAALDDVLQREILAGGEPLPWNRLIDLLRRSGIGSESTLHRAQALVADAETQRIYRRNEARMRELDSLMAVSREIIASFKLENLTQAMASTFPRVGLAGAALCLFTDSSDPLRSARVAAAFRSGEAVPVPAQPFSPRELVPASVSFASSAAQPLIVEPLYYREDRLGYLVFEQVTDRGIVYDTLASEIGSALEGAVLVDRALAAEREIEDRSQRIEALVRPMLESIAEASANVADQRRAIEGFEELDRRSAQSVKEMDSSAASLAESLKRTGALVSEIEGITEVINVVAINASIEAAHVGTAGAGFSVIAGEVRKLAEATRKNSAGITGFLSGIDERIGALSSSNKELADSFAALRSTIQGAVRGLEAITAQMADLGRGSSEILSIMNRK